jgi:drug/metabolite transporter (DMT)-like permease
MTVAIRVALSRGSATASRAAATPLVTSFTITLLASFVRHDYTDAWKFFLAGILAPGLSQILFTRAVADVGASRTSVTVGTAPLFALAIAFTLLGEPVEAQLVVGAVAIVAGGTILVAEPDRPVHLRSFGILCALGAAVLFAIRDNIVRSLHAHGSPETVAAATMLAGMLVATAAARGLPSRGDVRSLAPAGLLFGFSYICLFEAYFHTAVSPVVLANRATESLWGRARRARDRTQRGGGVARGCGGARDRRRKRPDRPRRGLTRICYKEA